MPRIGVGLGIDLLRANGLDPAASAFFAATGITGATEQQAVNTLVTSLKSAGLWSKMKAVYPFVTDNRNLLSYTEDFGNAVWLKGGVVTVTANTTTAPDGTTTADTLSIASPSSRNVIYQLFTPIANTTYTFSVYVKASSNQQFRIVADQGCPNVRGAQYYTATTSWQRVSLTFTMPSTVGGAIAIDNVSGSLTACDSTVTPATIFIWGAQLELGSTATTYQPIATTQQSYISSQFKYNLVNPVDSDAAFRLVFNGGWTMSNQGATPNGTNGYADTKLNQSGNLTPSNNHISVYLRTDFNGTTGYSPMDCGITDNISYSFQIISPRSNNLALYENGTHSMSVSNTNSQGMYTGTSTSSTSAKLYKNGSVIGSSILAQLRTMFNNNVYLGAANISTSNSATYFSPRQQAFASIGQSITDSEATALYNAVQSFNSSLNRAI